MKNYRVSDARAAMLLARQLCASGTYNWFRGQLCSKWRVVSSFCRRSKSEGEHALEQFRRFIGWMKNTPGLEAIATLTDEPLAIAQHYGIPTNFVDFTTDPLVAAFFAAHGDRPNDCTHGTIICLNTDDLQRFWQPMPARFPRPEFLKLSVSNLWRLEAQHGVFLFLPYDDVEKFYDFDRIVFSHSDGDINALPLRSEDVCPTRKSELELLLDQFFMNEQLIVGTREVRKMKGFKYHTLPNRANPWDPDVMAAPIPIHTSWSSISAWITPREESYSRAYPDIMILDLKLNSTTNEEAEIVQEAFRLILGFIRANRDARNTAVRWQVDERIAGPGRDKGGLEQALGALYDGLRRLPYTDDEVSAGMANCIALYRRGLQDHRHEPQKQAKIASEFIGDSVRVEFGAKDGSYSRGYVSSVELLAAVRNDIAQYIKPQWRGMCADVSALVLAVQAPQYLFDFRRLAALFARQIAPCQVLTRIDSAMFFSPARLSAFGLP